MTDTDDLAEMGRFESVSAKLLEGAVALLVHVFFSSSARFRHFSSFPSFCQIGWRKIHIFGLLPLSSTIIVIWRYVCRDAQ